MIRIRDVLQGEAWWCYSVDSFLHIRGLKSRATQSTVHEDLAGDVCRNLGRLRSDSVHPLLPLRGHSEPGGSHQQSLVESYLAEVISAADPTASSHHLERRAYYCNWSHRVRSNLLIVFSVFKATLTFPSVGTHAQAYRPKA